MPEQMVTVPMTARVDKPLAGETSRTMPSQFGNVAGATMSELAHRIHASGGRVFSEGPLSKVYAFWLSGMSCDGCTISALGATEPSVDENLTIDGEPWSAEGALPLWGTSEERRRVATAEWVRRLAPGAAAVIAIGTCATWGGIPASYGNPTGAMSMMDFLGKDYRSAFGLPVINVPGCAPLGDNFTETVAMLLLFLNKQSPLPEFDELGRPAWLFGDTVHRKRPRAGWCEEGTFAKEYGDKECLVDIGCWGPVVDCNITER